MKKRSLSLIECLVAVAIVALIALPLARHPAFFFQKEVAALQELEKKRLAELSFLEIKKAPPPPWETQRTKKNFPLSPLVMDLGPLGQTPVTRSYTWNVIRPKKNKDETLRLVRIDIYFNEHKYTSYNILVEKSQIR
ncbi:MAG: hypothetical protein KBC64_02320 [Simkaniaceae bacterium]|nr:hypothetical protein [Simkaniaceae bacterium]